MFTYLIKKWKSSYKQGKKIIVFLTTCFVLPAISFAQEIEWQNRISGSSNDILNSVSPTSDGGVICGGQSLSGISGDKTEINQGQEDLWVVKLDESGTIQWQNTIGGSDRDLLNSISQTADGGYICGGWSNSGISGDKTELSLGDYDLWIIKLDASGNIQWQNTIGGSATENILSIAQTADGGYICGGVSNSNISGDKTENSMGVQDYWVIKLDASGTVQWQNTIGGSNEDWVTSISQTTDGGYICGGYSKSPISGDKTENSLFGSFDYWVVKLDGTGTIQWQNTISAGSTDYLYSIGQTADGGYICGGFSWSNMSGDKTENGLGVEDGWVIKLDASGNIQWQNTIGGNGSDYIMSIDQTADGGYICGGQSTSGISGDKTENTNGSFDYWIIKLSASGEIEWQNAIGGTSPDYIGALCIANDGGFICGGHAGTGLSGDLTEVGLGIDYWVVKLTEKYNTVTGKLFVDNNSNNAQDAGELSLFAHKVTEQNTGRFGFSRQNGVYNVIVLDSGNFTVTPDFLNSWYTAAPLNHSAYFSNLLQTDPLNDFAFQPLPGSFNDVCLTITPVSPFRPGFDARYRINYKNEGTTILTPDIIFFPDDNLTFVSSFPVANSVTPDSVVWNLGSMTPFQTGSISVIVHVNNTTPLGTFIKSNARMEPVSGDANPACNYSEWGCFTVGPYDPNAILVDRDTVLTTQLSNPPYLDYVIYFQNTGNDTAFNVKVLNPVDTNKLDISTIEFVTSSHPVNLNYIRWERCMEFKFDNILLPDSNINETASHGFIRYRIKPKTTLVAGDSIGNTAYIYFDFNLPVQTDTAMTKIVLPTGANEFTTNNGQWTIYPNPVTNNLTIQLPRLSADNGQLIIYDLYGRQVIEQEIKHPGINESNPGQNRIFVNTSSFANGIYLIQLRTGENIYRGKFVKE